MSAASDLSRRLDAARSARTSSPEATAAAIAGELVQDGMAFFRLQPDRAAFLQVVDALGVVDAHPHGDEDGVTRIQAESTPAGRATRGGFTTRGLYPHTDRSSTALPSEYLAQLCARNRSQGGGALLLDGERLLARLEHEDPTVRQVLEEPASVVFGGEAQHRGAILEPCAQDRLRLRFRHDDFGFYGRKVAAALETLLRIIDEEAIELQLSMGDGYVIDNLRWLHGRAAYDGEREMWRILFNGPGPFGLRPGVRAVARG